MSSLFCLLLSDFVAAAGTASVGGRLKGRHHRQAGSGQRLFHDKPVIAWSVARDRCRAAMAGVMLLVGLSLVSRPDLCKVALGPVPSTPRTRPSLLNDQPSALELIELPGHFLFKVIVSPTQTSQDQLLAVAKATLGRPNLRHGIRTTASRTGKYQSISINLFIETHEEIKALYRVFGASEGVVMVL